MSAIVDRFGVDDLLTGDFLLHPGKGCVELGAEEYRERGDVEVEEQDDDGAYGAVGLVVGAKVRT